MKGTGEQIVTIFDVPHLLKSIRNNMLKYNVVTGSGVAKWNHVRLLDSANSSLYILLLITKMRTATKTRQTMGQLNVTDYNVTVDSQLNQMSPF